MYIPTNVLVRVPYKNKRTLSISLDLVDMSSTMWLSILRFISPLVTRNAAKQRREKHSVLQVAVALSSIILMVATGIIT